MYKRPFEKHDIYPKKTVVLGVGVVLMFALGTSFGYNRKSIAVSENTSESAVVDDVVQNVDADIQTAVSKVSDFELICEQIGLSVDNIEIDLPDVENVYELLFVNDMHILNVDEYVVSESKEAAQVREESMFRTPTGMAPSDAWLSLSSILDDFSADGLIFGGDMMDFISPSNMQTLSEGLSKIQTPYMYLRADHDHGTWYSGASIDRDGAIAYQKDICAYEDMFVLEYPEFYVLGWNNSTSQLTGTGLETARSIWNNGKPILLATHVPINSIVDDSLAQAASDTDPKNRIKLWGTGCLYQPDENTMAFLNMLYEEQSPVKAIFSGHLHFKYEVQLTEQTIEYVFAPAFDGKIAKIVIK